MATTRGLGTDPLTNTGRRVPGIIPGPASAAADAPTEQPATSSDGPAEAQTAPRADPAPPKRSKSVARGKSQVTAYIHTTVVEQARNAVMHTMTKAGAPRNLSALIESAIVHELQRLSDELNNGKPFPQREVELMPGRPGGGY
jgi:hypothetical protein